MLIDERDGRWLWEYTMDHQKCYPFGNPFLDCRIFVDSKQSAEIQDPFDRPPVQGHGFGYRDTFLSV